MLPRHVLSVGQVDFTPPRLDFFTLAPMWRITPWRAKLS